MSDIKIVKKKPIMTEAVQITGTVENIKEIRYFCGKYEFNRVSNFTYKVGSLEGDMIAYNSDWVVKEVEGYPLLEFL
jgi:hypothetical protein